MDPYAKVISGRDRWGEEPNWDNPYQYRSRIAFDTLIGKAIIHLR